MSNHPQILIVDDDPYIRQILEYALNLLDSNCEIATAKNGQAALNEINKQAFDLLVTDYRMPDMTGLELIEVVRQTLPDIQIVLMTSYYSAASLRKMTQQHNLADYITKPFDIEKVQAMVGDLLGLADNNI